MKQRIICKTLAIAVIILFLGLAIQPSVAVQPVTKIDIEPKDYLFQTIIDIANNPEVKNLLEKYDNDLFNVDIDRSVYRKLFLRNPRLMFNTLLIKPSMSVDYLDKCYDNGIEIADILGEDRVIEIKENVEFTDTKFFDNLNNIISNDEELSNRLETLKEMNEDLNLERRSPIICFLLTILFTPFFLWFFLFGELSLVFLLIDNILFFKIFNMISYLVFIPLGIITIAMINFGCFGDEP